MRKSSAYVFYGIAVLFAAFGVLADSLPPDASYRPLPTLPFNTVKASCEVAKPAGLARQKALLNQRCDLSDLPIPGIMMAGGRKAVQGGVRVKLMGGMSWDQLASYGS